MISDLRAALASSNEKVRLLETTVQGLQKIEPQTACEDEAEGECPKIVAPAVCLRCSGDKEAAEEVESETPVSTVPLIPPELHKARNEWSTLFHERREIQHKMAKLDQLENDLEHKIHSKQQSLDRVGQICLSNIR